MRGYKKIEEPEKKRKFGEDIMSLEGEIDILGLEQRAKQAGEPYNRREIWESQKKCRCEGIGLTSAVRVDVFRHAWMNDGFIVHEVKDGKPLESRFNSKLEPVAGGTAPASLVEEHRKNLEEFMNGEFFRHAIDRTKEAPTTVKVQGEGLEHRFIYLSKKIASEMQLEYKMSCKLEEGRDSEGDYLLMTPLKTSAIQERIRKGHDSYFVVIPEDMLVIVGLKIGDYITWHVKEGELFLRKAEGSEGDAGKVIRSGVSAAVTIPKEFVERFGLGKGEYGIWRFDEDENGKPRLWLELSKDNPHIVAIIMQKRRYGNKKYIDEFTTSIPHGLGEWLKSGDEVLREVRDGKVYVRKKQ
jgi:antitoxin component of MazEF toxin-antitoxin module